jgi:hypothetical protein
MKCGFLESLKVPQEFAQKKSSYKITLSINFLCQSAFLYSLAWSPRGQVVHCLGTRRLKTKWNPYSTMCTETFWKGHFITHGPVWICFTLRDKWQ